MRWSTSNPLTVWTLVVVLSVIALVLILPDDVDLPDTAFHRNSSPLAIRSISQQARQAKAYAGLVRLLFPSVSSSTLHFSLRESSAWHLEDRPLEHDILRC